MKYNYMVKGRAADGQTWNVTGQVSTEAPGQFMNTPALVMVNVFMKLTEGRAQYGKPGVGCRGPYQVTGMLIEEDASASDESIQFLDQMEP